MYRKMKALIFASALLLCAAVAFANGGLYAIEAPTNNLAHLDVKTGKVFKQFAANPDAAFANGLASVDSARGIYWALVDNITANCISLVGLSTSTGEIQYSIETGLMLTGFVGAGQYIDVVPANGNVLVVGRDAQQQEKRTVKEYNLKTGNLRTVYVLFEDLDLLGGASAFDSLRNLYWIQMAVNVSGTVELHLAAIDVQGGTLVNFVPDQSSSNSLLWYPPLNSLISLGIVLNSTAPHGFTRAAFLLPETGVPVQEMWTLDQYPIIFSGSAVVDSHGGRVIAVFDAPENTSTAHHMKHMNGNGDMRMSHMHGMMNDDRPVHCSHDHKSKVHECVEQKTGKSFVTVKGAHHRELGCPMMMRNGGMPMDLIVVGAIEGELRNSVDFCDLSVACPWNFGYQQAS